MSWRETMGIGASSLVPSAHNSQKAQNSVVPGNCANSAHSALGDSEDEHSKLLEILATACQGLDISPIDVFNALAGDSVFTEPSAQYWPEPATGCAPWFGCKTGISRPRPAGAFFIPASTLPAGVSPAGLKPGTEGRQGRL